MNKILTAIAAAALSGTMLATSASAGGGAFDFLDPCIKASDSFRAKRNEVIATLDKAVLDADQAAPPAEYRDLWMKAKKEQLRSHFDAAVAPNLTQAGVTDLDGAFVKWFDANMAKVAAGDLEKLITVSFRQELKSVRISQRAEGQAEIDKAQSELDGTCKMDAGNQTLRVTVSAILAPINTVAGNIEGAKRESGELDKVLRATTGISVKDIRQHGIFGGPNSFFRKPFG